jgi:hypothetical protein
LFANIAIIKTVCGRRSCFKAKSCICDLNVAKIIGDLKSFEVKQTSKNISIENFVGFLNQKYLGQKLTSSPVEAPSKNEENNICQIVAFMYRYAKASSKRL